MKNIGHITFLKNQYNYGQRLQAFAIQKYIKNTFNINIQTIDAERQSGWRDFDEFEQKYMNIVQYDPSSRYDQLIVGGDQVFNPHCVGLGQYDIYDATRFNCNNVISFSASENGFVYKYNDYIELFFKNISKFNGISIREKSSVKRFQDIVNQFTHNAEVLYHIDPVFLFSANEWRAIEIVPQLSINDHFTFEYSYKSNGFEVLDNNVLCRITSDGLRINNDMPSPSEWLWYIDNTDIVKTVSFHGFAFSVIFNKKINCGKMNSYRIQSLINTLNIKIQNDIIVNYDEVLQNIEKEKQRSFQYLDKYLLK